MVNLWKEDVREEENSAGVGKQEQTLADKLSTEILNYKRNYPGNAIITKYSLFSNSIDPDETAHDEPSHLDLSCLTFSLSTLNIYTEASFQAIVCF